MELPRTEVTKPAMRLSLNEQDACTVLTARLAQHIHLFTTCLEMKIRLGRRHSKELVISEDAWPCEMESISKTVNPSHLCTKCWDLDLLHTYTRHLIHQSTCCLSVSWHSSTKKAILHDSTTCQINDTSRCAKGFTFSPRSSSLFLSVQETLSEAWFTLSNAP